MRKYLAILMVLAGLVLVAAGFAPNVVAADEKTVYFKLQVAEVLHLTITGGTVDAPVTFDVTNPESTDPVSGDPSVKFTVKANRNWRLTQAAVLDFSASIPSSRVSWTASNSESGTFSSSETDILGTGSHTKSVTDITVTYKFTPDWADDAGTYTTSVVYTLEPQ